MLHLLYILAFTCIAFLAISNLIRSLINLSAETQKFYPPNYSTAQGKSTSRDRQTARQTIHPELLDERGKVIEEPLLVMRSVSVEDARQQLDALYNSSPNKNNDPED
ncbi:MAG: DUF2973 domain-containing protein [Pleurocapsa sp.]